LAVRQRQWEVVTGALNRVWREAATPGTAPTAAGLGW